MLTIENVEITGWESAIRGMRNPMNSWEKSDTFNHMIGDADARLMMTLRRGGTDHRKFMRMITVYMDITAPLYWWKEFDTYKVGTVANSCSTMHKIHSKEFMLDDFSHEHLEGETLQHLHQTIQVLERCRLNYRRTEYPDGQKNWWWQMIQLLPSSYNQRRTIMLNYEVLANIYNSRRNHKLDEWHTFCDWAKTLLMSELITGEVVQNG